MYQGRNARYYYRITDRTNGQVVKEGYVTGAGKSDCEGFVQLAKLDAIREMGLSAANEDDRWRLKIYMKAAPAEPEKRRTIEQVRQISGMNRMAFARAYGIPYRTITDWEHGLRQPPEWLAGILEKAVRYDKQKEAEMVKKYRVKEEYADSWYGGDADLDYIEECQTKGLPQEDIDHMVREYGREILDQLEEI